CGGLPAERNSGGILQGNVLEVLRTQTEASHRPGRRSIASIDLETAEEADDGGPPAAAPVDLPERRATLGLRGEEHLGVAHHLLEPGAQCRVSDRTALRELPEGALSDRLADPGHLLGGGEEVVEGDP